MRSFELSQEIPASRALAWQKLTCLDEWHQWNTLLPGGRGELRVGAVLDLRLRGADGRCVPHCPRVVSITPPAEVTLMATFVHRRLLTMVHVVTLDELAPSRSRLRHHWTVTGLLVPLLWPSLARTLGRFIAVGDDLSAALDLSRE